MILEFDAGNSCIKWRHLDPTNSVVEAEGSAVDVNGLMAAVIPERRPEFVRICSVRGGAEVDEISSWIKGVWDLELHVAEVSRGCGGVSNHYSDTGKLGIDRWLAMLAARQRSSEPCVVVDSGTAITIDVLDAQGSHGGGFILPGLRLMRESLEAGTGIRLTTGYSLLSLQPGHSTDAAVYNGTLSCLVAIIESVADSVLQASASQTVAPRLFFTGGDAELLAESTSLPGIEVVAGLVLDGLAVACPYSRAGLDTETD
jgi:type III pantothenate kinase